MALDTQVRDSVGTLVSGSHPEIDLNRMGFQTSMNWVDKLASMGYLYTVTLGTENAPINSTTGIDDQLVWALVDNVAANVIIPIHFEAHVATWTTATNIEAMIEIDNGKARYSSGGSAFTPINLRTDNPRSSGGAAYVGTDVTTAAKTSGGSIELARCVISEDAKATATADEKYFVWPAKTSVPVFIVGVGSLLFHFGAATADVTGYGSMIFAEIPKAAIVGS